VLLGLRRVSEKSRLRQRLAYDRRGGANVYGSARGANGGRIFRRLRTGHGRFTACMKLRQAHGRTCSASCDHFSWTSRGRWRCRRSRCWCPLYARTLGERNSFLPEMDCDIGRGGKRKRLAVDLDSNFKPIGQVEVFVRKPSHSLRPKITKRGCARMRFAARNLSRYVCILLIASACLFPAVWVR